MPDFFIRRPIFAWVVALLISLIGLLAIPSLPIAQYPDIAPPVITLRTTYPGASAQDTEEAVTAVIEKEINGAPGLMYMSATSSSDGAVEIAATFTQGTDPDIAAVEVQKAENRGIPPAGICPEGRSVRGKILQQHSGDDLPFLHGEPE